jgi:hypothetical protein
VLNVSLDLHVIDTAYIVNVEKAIRRFVAAGQGALLVLSSGNNDMTATRSTWAQGIAGVASILKAAVSRLAPGSPARSRVIVVTGTRNDGSFEPTFSNFITGGGTDIAAPAVDHLMLANAEVGDGELVQYSGTSFGAALVTGVAGLLWSMDSTLTPDQVRDYILLGAQEPRLSTQTGVYTARPSVPGAPETVYELDAYGALSLLSRTRQINVPLCGMDVRVGASNTSLVAEGRGTNWTIPLTLNAGEEVRGVDGAASASVAQGGRRIAVYTTADRSLVVNHRGQTIHSVSGMRRTYLEQDTADYWWQEGSPGIPGRELPAVTITGPRGTRQVSFAQRIPLSPGEVRANYDGSAQLMVSPDARYAVALDYPEPWDGSCPVAEPVNERIYVLPVDTPTSRLIGAIACYGLAFGGSVAWTHDATRALVVTFEPFSDPAAVRFRSVVVPAAVQASQVATGSWNVWGFTPDDSLAVTEGGQDPEGTDCAFAYRSLQSPGSIVGPTVPAQPGVCGVPRALPNAPRPVRASGFRPLPPRQAWREAVRPRR